MAGHDVSDEPRDERGRWTVGGASGVHEAGPVMNLTDPTTNHALADQAAKLAAETATKLGFNPKYVTISDERRTFELNGSTRNYAGAAFLDSHTENPEIAVYLPFQTWQPKEGERQLDVSGVKGTTAHEVEHQKYQAFINDYRKDAEAMRSDPDYHKDSHWVPFDPNNPEHARLREKGGLLTSDNKIREPGFMQPNGLLNEPYDKKYPIYQAWTKANMPLSDEFEKSDGVSGYSRDWWDAYRNRTVEKPVQLPQAMHETLAEIARIRYGQDEMKAEHKANIKFIKANGGDWTAEDEKKWQANNKAQLGHIVRKKDGFLTKRKGLAPIWNDLYKAVEENWKRRKVGK